MTIIGDLSFVHTLFFFLCTLLIEHGVVRARVLCPHTCCCFFRIILNLFYSYFAFLFFLSFDGDAVRVVVLLLFVWCGVVVSGCCCRRCWWWLTCIFSFLQAHRVTFCPYLDTSSILTIFFLVLKVPRLLFNSLSAPLTFFFACIVKDTREIDLYIYYTCHPLDVGG